MRTWALRLFIQPCGTGSGPRSRAPTAAQTKGWAPIARGESTLLLAPTGSGKTLAAFLWCLNRLMFAPPPAAKAPLPRALRLAAQGARGRRRAQPARAARRHRPGRRPARRGGPRADACCPHRRHAGERARALPARAGRHPHHHAGVALPAADLERARGLPQRSTRSSSTRSTRSSRPSAAPTSRCRSSGSRRSPTGRLQRIGLSATQRPLDEVARFLGGVEGAARRARRTRRPRRSRPSRARTRPSKQAAAARSPQPRGAARDRTTSSPARPASRLRARSPSSTPARRRRSSCGSRCRSRTWRGSPSRSTSRAARPRRARRGRRSGPRSIRGCSS